MICVKEKHGLPRMRLIKGHKKDGSKAELFINEYEGTQYKAIRETINSSRTTITSWGESVVLRRF
jgi:hypothetical protein